MRSRLVSVIHYKSRLELQSCYDHYIKCRLLLVEISIASKMAWDKTFQETAGRLVTHVQPA